MSSGNTSQMDGSFMRRLLENEFQWVKNKWSFGKRQLRQRVHPLQYSCLGNPMDTEAWWAMVHGVAKSRTQLND